MKERTILLQHPMWDEPREFNYNHAMNILELEKQRPSGITLVEGQDVSAHQDAEDNSSSKETESDAVVDPADQGNTSEKSNRKSKRTSKGKASGK